ncbi:MAG: putative lipopolysaccharide heptosyltransferase III [Desulfobacca sp.]|uniref:putative lipopolysaccharide heptosyltransferase III n=1 Tax=Desulfobacca sp. TaxID=2067990 RepID=UPI00404AAF17
MMTFNNILLIQFKHLGDVLLITPVIRALHHAWPTARLSALVPRGMEAMLSDHPLLLEIMLMDRGERQVAAQLRFASTLRRRHFDLVLEFSGGDRGAIAAWLTGAGTRVSFAHPKRPWWHRLTFTCLAPPLSLRAHTVAKNLALVAALGIRPQHQGLEFFWSPATAATVQELMQSLHLRPQGFILMHPPARWLFKCWTATGYAQVIDALQREYDWPVVLTAAPVPQELNLIKEILGLVRTRPINLAGRLDLKTLGALIAQARLFVGVDSAPMHLAAAVQTPSVVLFGPSGSYNWGPWGNGHLVLTKNFDCQPCGRDGCNGSKISRCLTTITPAEVLAAIARQLQVCASPLSASV